MKGLNIYTSGYTPDIIDSVLIKFKIGKWYINPMMAENGTYKAKYVKIHTIDLCRMYGAKERYYLTLIFDEYISNGKLFKGEIKQSNLEYDRHMKEIDDQKISDIIRSGKYGI